MSFSIAFTEEKIPSGWIDRNEKASMATITIGDFVERHLVPLNFWTIEDYRKQWLTAVSRFMQEGNAVLITEMYDPKEANFIKGWSLKKSTKGRVDIINCIFFLDEIASFDSNNLHRFAHHTLEDTSEVSHWEIAVDDLKYWQSTLQDQPG